jgi:hypothetical protein
MTPERAIGGRAWPSVVFENPDHEYAFALWCNSTLGLLCHWWMANKTQEGRGTTTVTGVPAIPTLDVSALSDEQHDEARKIFERLSDARFLPFDQVDEDEWRAELDRSLLVSRISGPRSIQSPWIEGCIRSRGSGSSRASLCYAFDVFNWHCGVSCNG